MRTTFLLVILACFSCLALGQDNTASQSAMTNPNPDQAKNTEIVNSRLESRIASLEAEDAQLHALVNALSSRVQSLETQVGSPGNSAASSSRPLTPQEESIIGDWACTHSNPGAILAGDQPPQIIEFFKDGSANWGSKKVKFAILGPLKGSKDPKIVNLQIESPSNSNSLDLFLGYGGGFMISDHAGTNFCFYSRGKATQEAAPVNAGNGEMNRQEAEDIINQFLSTHSTINELTFRNGGFQAAQRDKIIYCDISIYRLTRRGLALGLGDYVQEITPFANPETGGPTLTLSKPISEKVVRVSGITETSPTEKSVEVITNYQFPEVMMPLSNYLFLGRKTTFGLRKYDDGWRVAE